MQQYFPLTLPTFYINVMQFYVYFKEICVRAGIIAAGETCFDSSHQLSVNTFL